LQKLFSQYAEVAKETYPHQYDFSLAKGETHR
jgi:hypothetical protein